jgi:hypothetical protein
MCRGADLVMGETKRFRNKNRKDFFIFEYFVPSLTMMLILTKNSKGLTIPVLERETVEGRGGQISSCI